MANSNHTMLIIMRPLVTGLLLYAFIGFADAQTNIRQFDFKNFSYPWTHSFMWPSKLVWLDMSKGRHVRLVNGRWQRDAGNGITFTGLTLEEVQFADVTGDGQTDVIVILRYDTGGTQYLHYVYVYSFVGAKPKLLACFHSGVRDELGLYKVYAQKGKLVVELFDPEKSTGACCSSGFIRTRYRGITGGLRRLALRSWGRRQQLHVYPSPCLECTSNESRRFIFCIGRITLSRSGIAPAGDSHIAVCGAPVVGAAAKCGDMAGAGDDRDGMSAVSVSR